MMLGEKIKKLVEARKYFNQLGDAIYEIAGGNIDDSRFAIIYTNYEEEILSQVLQTLQATDSLEDSKKIVMWFGAMILDLAQDGVTYVEINNKQKEVTVDSIVPALMFMDNYVEHYNDQ